MSSIKTQTFGQKSSKNGRGWAPILPRVKTRGYKHSAPSELSTTRSMPQKKEPSLRATTRNLLTTWSYRHAGTTHFPSHGGILQRSLREERFHLDSLEADEIADLVRNDDIIILFVLARRLTHTVHPPWRIGAGHCMVPVAWACRTMVY
jgi:hypothetical protein